MHSAADSPVVDRVYGGAWRLLKIHADGGFHQLRAVRKKPAIYLLMKTGDA